MIRQAILRLVKRVVLGKQPSDEEEMRARIEQLRSKGAKIGKNVRLIGRIDGLNPHLVTIGDSCVIGAGAIIAGHVLLRSLVAGR